MKMSETSEQPAAETVESADNPPVTEVTEQKPRRKPRKNEFDPNRTFKYLKAVVRNHTPEGVVERSFHFLNNRELYDNQLYIGLDEEFWKHYRYISSSYVSRLKHGKLYRPKTKPPMAEYLRIETVELTPDEYRKLKEQEKLDTETHHQIVLPIRLNKKK